MFTAEFFLKKKIFIITISVLYTNFTYIIYILYKKNCKYNKDALSIFGENVTTIFSEETWK